jgi:hypothetical protein
MKADILKEEIERDYVKEMLTHFVTFKGECYHEENEDKERFLNDPLVKSAIKSYTEGIVKIVLSKVKEAREEEREICKKIYIDEVDWSEWAISDKEAGEDFDEERAKLAELKK